PPPRQTPEHPRGRRCVSGWRPALPGLATTRSSRLSPSTSAATTHDGEGPVATLVAAANVPWPMPRRTLTLLAVVLVAIRSTLPSPSRSPAATDWLPEAIANELSAENP